MKLKVYSKSQSFRQFLDRHSELAFEHCSELESPSSNRDQIHLLHISSLGEDCLTWLKQASFNRSLKIGVCSDVPNIGEMLDCVQLGTKAYCNSYMASVHFQQMIRLLEHGQSWFPPRMLEQTFELAHRAANPEQSLNSLETLTNREKQIAKAVAEGKSNRQIARHLEITERTVKSHITNIFKKLEIKDRVALVLYLKAS